jgi:glycine dehydrogenase subunit 1
VLSGGLHPHYAEACWALGHSAGVATERLAAAIDGEAAVVAAIDADTACVVVQTPNVFGTVTDVSAIAEAAHAAGALLVVVTTEAVSFGLLKPPGEMGADIAVAEGQSIGNALSFGGPYVGLFACREAHVRQMPGRLCGETVDAAGKRGFVLTLSTREQHIRREKATSNICTNSGLCALAFTVHMTLLGETGLRRLAEINHARARTLRAALAEVPGVEVLTPRFFNEFAVRLPKPAAEVVEALAGRDIIAGVPVSRLDPGGSLDDVLLVCATETTTHDDIAAFAEALSEEIGQ